MTIFHAGFRFNSYINEPENFLKHASRDPDASYDLRVEWTQVLIYEATTKWMRLNAEAPAPFVMFMIWYVVQHPHVFRAAPEIKPLLDKIDLSQYAKDRKKFAAEFLRYGGPVVRAMESVVRSAT